MSSKKGKSSEARIQSSLSNKDTTENKNDQNMPFGRVSEFRRWGEEISNVD
jgi:hypothetical protein